MTPVASTAAATRGRHVTIPRGPRRVSGPARRRPAPPPTTLGPRLLRRTAELADARLLERLVRGRGWIAVIGVMLMGLVFVQVSMLQLNTGIGRDVETAAKLERSNQLLRNTVADLGASDRVTAAAQKYGMVMPTAGDVRYLRAGAAGPDAAVRGISAPAPVVQQSTTPVTPATGVTPTATGVTPATTGVTPTGTATPSTTTAPVTETQPQVAATTPSTTAVAASTGGAAPTP